MHRYKSPWRAWVVGSVFVLILATAAIEIFDLPYFLLGGPDSPVHYAELVLHAILILGAGAMVWFLMHRFEHRLNATLNQLERLASVDDLTGIPNRRQVLQRLENEVQRSNRFDRPISVAIMDLDGFKSINDKYGHLVGDRTLVDFTRVVTRHIRAQDFFGRLGGDEFLVIFLETRPADAAAVLERIRQQWYQAYAPTTVPGTAPVTLSAGVTAPRLGDTSMTDCLRRADEALYAAKTGGRNKIQID